jgi:hypothetical protein
MARNALRYFIHFSFFTSLMAEDVLAQGLRDVKPPLAFPLSALFLVMVFCSTVLAIVLAWMFLRRKKNEKLPPRPERPWEKAITQLKALEKQDLVAAGQWDRYYSRLTDILRKYIEEQLSIKAPEMTTEEFLQHLQRSAQLEPAQKVSLKSFLESSDLVKFAKYAPDPSEAKKSFELALRFIQETRPKQEQAV